MNELSFLTARRNRPNISELSTAIPIIPGQREAGRGYNQRFTKYWRVPAYRGVWFRYRPEGRLGPVQDHV